MAGVAAVVAGAALTACTSAVAGTARSAGQPPERAPNTVEKLLGEFTTFEPCSLAEPSVFDDIGAATFSTHQGFAYCRVEIDVDGDQVVVNIGTLDRLRTGAEVEPVRVDDVADGLWIGQLKGDRGACKQVLVFADDITL